MGKQSFFFGLAVFNAFVNLACGSPQSRQSYVKMHFSFVKSNILCKWLRILFKFYVTMFTPEHSLLRRSIPSNHPARLPTLPATPPCQPPHLARHPTLPATLSCPPPTLHPTPPCLPASPDCLAVLLSHNCVVSVATRKCSPCPPVTAVCVWCKSTCNPLQYSTHPI